MMETAHPLVAKVDVLAEGVVEDEIMSTDLPSLSVAGTLLANAYWILPTMVGVIGAIVAALVTHKRHLKIR